MQAYKRNALRFHPDRNQGDEADKERAKQQFQAVSQAYEELSGALARRDAARAERFTARPTQSWPSTGGRGAEDRGEGCAGKKLRTRGP